MWMFWGYLTGVLVWFFGVRRKRPDRALLMLDRGGVFFFAFRRWFLVLGGVFRPVRIWRVWVR